MGEPSTGRKWESIDAIGVGAIVAFVLYFFWIAEDLDTFTLASASLLSVVLALGVGLEWTSWIERRKPPLLRLRSIEASGRIEMKRRKKAFAWIAIVLAAAIYFVLTAGAAQQNGEPPQPRLWLEVLAAAAALATLPLAVFFIGPRIAVGIRRAQDAPASSQPDSAANTRRLMQISFLALLTTSMTFAVRAVVWGNLINSFRFDEFTQGFAYVINPAFWGFGLALALGGFLVDEWDNKTLLVGSGIGHIVAAFGMLVVPTSSPVALWLLMLLFGASQGIVEATINPLCTTLFPHEKAGRITVLHSAWPLGFILGIGLALVVEYALSPLVGPDSIWRWQMLVVTLVPTLAYLLLLRNQSVPKTQRVIDGVSLNEMRREVLRPMFIVFWLCMWLVLATELGANQWMVFLIEEITQPSGTAGVSVLAIIGLVVFGLRCFGRSVQQRVSRPSLLMCSIILSSAGLCCWGIEKPAVVAGAILFGIGTAYLWPTIMGVTAEQFPRGGALALALMANPLPVAVLMPIIGSWYDPNPGHEGAASAFAHLAVIPMLLVLPFLVLVVRVLVDGGYSAAWSGAEPDVPEPTGLSSHQ